MFKAFLLQDETIAYVFLFFKPNNVNERCYLMSVVSNVRVLISMPRVVRSLGALKETRKATTTLINQGI